MPGLLVSTREAGLLPAVHVWETEGEVQLVGVGRSLPFKNTVLPEGTPELVGPILGRPSYQECKCETAFQ